jgi:predicted nucleic acid-binding protein
MGVKSRAIHAGEAACIAVAVSRELTFATDDGDAVLAYQALGGHSATSTLMLLHEAATRDILDEADAKADWNRLNQRLRGRLNLPWFC